MVGSNVIAASYGGCWVSLPRGVTRTSRDQGVGEGFLGTSEPQFLNGYIFRGGQGGLDTNSHDEETHGASSYWGDAPSPGAASGSGQGGNFGIAGEVSDGFVMFEWN